MKKTLIVMAVLAVAAVAAQASVSAVWALHTVNNPRLIGGVQHYIWNMSVATTTDWTNSRIEANLTSGSMNHVLYMDPMTEEMIPVAQIQGVTDSGVAAPTGTNLGVAAHTETPTSMVTSWFNTNTTDIGTFLLGRLVLSENANGTLMVKNYDVSVAGVGVTQNYNIVNGQIVDVPEPATMSLLAVGGVLALIRRRK